MPKKIIKGSKTIDLSNQAASNQDPQGDTEKIDKKSTYEMQNSLLETQLWQEEDCQGAINLVHIL